MRGRAVDIARALVAASLLAAAGARAADLTPRPIHPGVAPPAVHPEAVSPHPRLAATDAVAQFEPPPPAPGSPAARARGAPAAPPVEPDAPPREPLSPSARERWQERFDTRLALFLRQRTLDEAFGDIATLAGLRVRVNDRLDDETVTALRLSGTVREALDELTRRYNLVWFAERDLVDIARADTATVRTFRIDGVTDAEIRDAIARFGLINVDFALEVDERNGIARIFAPPRLASRLESIIVGLRAESEPAPQGPIEIIKFGERVRAVTN